MDIVSIRPEDAFQSRMRKMGKGELVIRFILNNGLLVALVAEIILFGLIIPKGRFLTISNLVNTLQIAGGGGIAAVCFTVALISGVIDFSIINISIMGGMIFAWLYGLVGLPIGVAILAGLAAVLVCELINCFLILRVKIYPLIATMAVGLVAMGLSMAIQASSPEPGYVKLHDKTMYTLANAKIAGIPMMMITTLVVFAVLYVVMNHTKLGAHIYAMGGNSYAAHLFGIKSRQITIGIMAMVGVAAYIVALYIVGRTFYGSMANTIKPDPFIAALFAGVGLYGGTGKIERTLLAILFLAFMVTGMAILNVHPVTRSVVDGLAFVAAILLETIRQYVENR